MKQGHICGTISMQISVKLSIEYKQWLTNMSITVDLIISLTTLINIININNSNKFNFDIN